MSWKKVKLGDLCDMNSGGTPRRNNPDYYSGNIPWAKISDIESANGFIETTEEKISIEALQSIGNRIFPKGTLLLAMYGSVGKTAITGIEMSTNQAILGIRPKDESKIYLPYLKYWFYFIKESLMHRAVGGTLQNISLGIVKELQIPLPPLPIQQKIAAILDQADALRKKDRQLLAKYDELLQAVFYDMFGDPVKNEKRWEKKKLETITTKITDGKHGDCIDEANSGYYFLSAKDLIDGELKFYDVRQIKKEEFHEVHKRTRLEVDDVLLGNTGASIGKIGIVTDKEKAAVTTFQKSISIITANKKLVSPFYLRYFLEINWKSFSTSSGSAMSNLLLSQIRSFNIITPPIDLQNSFTTVAQNINRQKKQLKQQLEQSENLFQSLLQRAFKGELVK